MFTCPICKKKKRSSYCTVHQTDKDGGYSTQGVPVCKDCILEDADAWKKIAKELCKSN